VCRKLLAEIGVRAIETDLRPYRPYRRSRAPIIYAGDVNRATNHERFTTLSLTYFREDAAVEKILDTVRKEVSLKGLGIVAGESHHV